MHDAWLTELVLALYFKTVRYVGLYPIKTGDKDSIENTCRDVSSLAG